MASDKIDLRVGIAYATHDGVAPGADRPLPDYLQKLLEHWQQTRPHLIGRQ